MKCCAYESWDHHAGCHDVLSGTPFAQKSHSGPLLPPRRGHTGLADMRLVWNQWQGRGSREENGLFL